MLNHCPKYDAFGSSHSMNWHSVAFRIAGKTNEKCEHLDLYQILITMAPLCGEIITGIKFVVSCGVCNKKMENTSVKLSNKFLKFYGK
jgi:hypothetical protein